MIMTPTRREEMSERHEARLVVIKEIERAEKRLCKKCRKKAKTKEERKAAVQCQCIGSKRMKTLGDLLLQT